MKYKYKEIGEILKKRRVELGKDLAGIAEETKISEKYIAAIEDGEPREFPSLVYYALFAHSYAREMGLDADELFAKEVEPEPIPLQKTVGPVQPAETPAPEKKQESPPRKKSPWRAILTLAAVIVVAVAIIVIILLKGKTPTEGEPAINETQKAAIEEEFPLDSTRIPRPAVDSSVVRDTQTVKQTVDRRLHLTLSVNQTCWLLIMADNDTSVFGSLPPGTNREVTALNKIIISAGNPAGVQFKLNDTLLKPLSLASRPVRGLEITPENKQTFYLLPKDSANVGR